jgi:SAM-dependent methyltransferase
MNDFKRLLWRERVLHLAWRFYERPFVEHYPRVLRRLLSDQDEVLDVGCGNGMHLVRAGVRSRRCVGIDLYEPSLRSARDTGFYDELHQRDVMKLSDYCSPKSFDIVLCSDLIEHLDKLQGYELIRMMTDISRKSVIVFTPNGFWVQEPEDGNDYQRHISGWTVREMKQLGFQWIVGIHGWKKFCEKYPKPLHRPYWFWRGLSSWSQTLFYFFPQWAFQMLCVKRLEGTRGV